MLKEMIKLLSHIMTNVSHINNIYVTPFIQNADESELK